MREIMKLAVPMVIGAVALYAVFAALLAVLVRWAWNDVAAGAFGAPEIDYSQAFALLVLVGMLFSPQLLRMKIATSTSTTRY